MKRRNFLKWAAAAALALGVGEGTALPALARGRVVAAEDIHIKDYLHKMRFFDQPAPGDLYVHGREKALLSSVVARLRRVRHVVGHGNFSLLSFDEALAVARAYASVEPFSKEELAFMEKIFYRDAAEYGFLGEKPLVNLTDQVKRSRARRDPRTGNFLFADEAEAAFSKISRTLGPEMILTSGIRGIAKQFYLFLRKAHAGGGNLSLASRSLAPPGYSYHGIGDFDVGQVGLGVDNFTERFTCTEVYHRLVDNGFATLRYKKNNLLGVRFEPWHIKIKDIV